jgi:hypothetical protein
MQAMPPCIRNSLQDVSKKRFELTFNARSAQHPHYPLDQAIKFNSHCQNRRTIIIEYGEYREQVLDRIRDGRCCTRDGGRVVRIVN